MYPTYWCHASLLLRTQSTHRIRAKAKWINSGRAIALPHGPSCALPVLKAEAKPSQQPLYINEYELNNNSTPKSLDT